MSRFVLIALAVCMSIAAVSSSPASCSHWCVKKNTNPKQYYCCPTTPKPIGKCPEVREACRPVFQSDQVGPQECFNDSQCHNDDLCCYDKCLNHYTCKPPVYT